MTEWTEVSYLERLNIKYRKNTQRTILSLGIVKCCSIPLPWKLKIDHYRIAINQNTLIFLVPIFLGLIQQLFFLPLALSVLIEAVSFATVFVQVALCSESHVLVDGWGVHVVFAASPFALLPTAVWRLSPSVWLSVSPGIPYKIQEVLLVDTVSVQIRNDGHLIGSYL